MARSPVQIFTMDVEKEIQPALQLSRLLKKHKRRGEFYITGKMVEKYPEECREISRHHIIGGHGYNHENFVKISIRKQERIIKKTIHMFNKHHIPITGWRFPGVNFTSASLEIITQLNLFDSSIRAIIWKKYKYTGFLRNWLKNLKNGALTTLTPYPANLKERPWAHADLQDNSFYKKSGRLMLHCWKYTEYRNELKQWLQSQSSE